MSTLYPRAVHAALDQGLEASHFGFSYPEMVSG